MQCWISIWTPVLKDLFWSISNRVGVYRNLSSAQFKGRWLTLVILISSNGLFFGFTGTLSIWSSVDSAPSITLFISFSTCNGGRKKLTFRISSISHLNSFVSHKWWRTVHQLLLTQSDVRVEWTDLSFICIWPSIGHSYNPPSIELSSITHSVWGRAWVRAYLESLTDLIIERSSPNTLPTLSCSRRISTLNHETFDITVEQGIVICSWCTKC